MGPRGRRCQCCLGSTRTTPRRREAGRTLVDIGAGCGWPGLYLAQRHGCRLVGLEPVVEGATTARDRARRDGHTESWIVRAAGTALPLRPRSVDAVVHTDVLC